jgi:hypothetical protein
MMSTRGGGESRPDCRRNRGARPRPHATHPHTPRGGLGAQSKYLFMVTCNLCGTCLDTLPHSSS